MGVSGLLPCVLPAAGRSLDLSELTSEARSSSPSSKRARPNHYETTIMTTPHNDKANHHPKIRMGIDVSGWIARICHGQGANLLDERHLSQYGRAGLLSKDPPTTTTTTDQQQQQEEKCAAFTRQCAEQVVRRILLVQEESGAHLLVVLDGATPPLKAQTCRDRRAHRQDAAAVRDAPPSTTTATITTPHHDTNHRMEEENENETARIRAARKAGVNPKQYQAIVALLLHELLPYHSIPFLVAPYEADGQLAYLASHKWLDVICTDDSDFMAHGVSSLLYRLQINHHPHHYGSESNTNAHTAAAVVGTATLLHKDDWGATPATPVSLLDFSTPMVACLFVAAGCDYCASLRGIGIGKARDAVHHAFYGGSSSNNVLRSLWHGLYQRCFSNPPLSHADKVAYEEAFVRALFLFRHAIVFCPLLGENVYAHIDTPDPEFMNHAPYASLHRQIIMFQSNQDSHHTRTHPKNVTDVMTVDPSLESIFGQLRDPDTAVAIAEGRLNPKTNQPYQLPPIRTHPQGETEANANVTMTAQEEGTRTAAATTGTATATATGTATPPIPIPTCHTTPNSTPVATHATTVDATMTVLVQEEAVVPLVTFTALPEGSMESSTAPIMEEHSCFATQESIPIAPPTPALQQSSQGSTTMGNEDGSNNTPVVAGAVTADAAAAAAARVVPQEAAVHVPSMTSPGPATSIVVDALMEECSFLDTQESIPIAPIPELQQPSQESKVELGDSSAGSNVGVAADAGVAHEASAAASAASTTTLDYTALVEEYSFLATQESIPMAPPPPALQQSSQESTMIGSNDDKMRKDDSSSPSPATTKRIAQEETTKGDEEEDDDEEAMLDLGTQPSHGFGGTNRTKHTQPEGVARTTNLVAVLEPPPLPQVADDSQPQHKLQELVVVVGSQPQSMTQLSSSSLSQSAPQPPSQSQQPQQQSSSSQSQRSSNLSADLLQSPQRSITDVMERISHASDVVDEELKRVKDQLRSIQDEFDYY